MRRLGVVAVAMVVIAGGCTAAPEVVASPSPTVVIDLAAYDSMDDALIAGARTSDLALARAALDAGASPDALDESTGYGALVLALLRGDADMTRLLADAGATIEFESEDFMFEALAWATTAEVAQILMDAGAAPSDLALMSAVYENRPPVVAVLLEAGADPNLVWEDPSIPGGYTTPLLTACYNYAPEVARLLLEYGADPTVAAADGTTPRDWAEFRSDAELVALLESYGG